MSVIVVLDKYSMLHKIHKGLCDLFTIERVCKISNNITNEYLGNVNGDDILNMLWEEGMWKEKNSVSCMKEKESCV